MEDKINKLFAIFSDFKNQQLFSLALAQIVNIYNDYPACLYQILRKTNKLIYSKASDPRLRLEHSQLAAAIIERTYKIYNNRLEEYLLQSQEAIPENLFHFEPLLNNIEVEQMCQEHIHNYEEIKGNLMLKCEQIDFGYLIRDQEVILGKDSKYLKRSLEYRNQKLDDETFEEQQEEEEEAMKKMGLSGNFNLANIQRLLELLSGESDVLKINQNSSEEEQDIYSSDDDVIGNYKKKPEQQQQQQQKKTNKKNQPKKYCVINPFNVIYNRALFELLNHKWQERHASALVLKSIVRQKGFLNLGFSYMIKGDEQEMNEILRYNLMTYISDKKGQLNKLEYLLTRCCVLIVMDRFADYFGNQTLMIVREAACQTAITLLTDRNYKNNIWIHYPDNFMKFVLLLKEFIEEAQRIQIYEVCQSALFLIKGLLQDKLQVIHDIFSEMLLDVGRRDNEDEVLELLADIWKQFLKLEFSNQYYNQVYEITMQQLKKQDDISFAGKAIFEFLSCLFEKGYQLQSEMENEIEIVKKFFFHRNKEVKEAFYKYLLTYISKNNSKNNDQRVITYMKIVFQNGLFEEKKEIFDILVKILQELSNHISLDQLAEFISFAHNIAVNLDYKKYFYLYDNSRKDAIDIHYPQIIQNISNQIDGQIYRVIKTAYLIQYIECERIITDELDPINFIYTMKNYLNNKINFNCQIDSSKQNGQYFDEIDLKIQVLMQQLNLLLKNYMLVEKEQEYLTIIQGFIKIFEEFAIAPAHSYKLRILYPQILQQLKLLGQIDYEMDSESIYKLQETMTDLVQNLQGFNKFSNELNLNFKVINSNHIESMIQRVKSDKFQIIQDIATERLAKQIKLNPNCCDLSSLYNKLSLQQQVTYILQQKNALKRKDYGRKKLIYHLLKDKELFDQWHLYFERLFLNQLNIIPKGLKKSIKINQQKILIKTDDLKLNIWGISLIQNAYQLFTQNQTHSEFNKWIYYLLNKLLNYIQIIYQKDENDQKQIIMEDNNSNVYLIEFDQTLKKIGIEKQTKQILIICAKFINLLSINDDKDTFDQVIILINTHIKNEQHPIYEILQMIVKEHPTSLASISGFLTLKIIKKLTAKEISLSTTASKLFGCLIPILTIMDTPYMPKDEQLKKKFKKAQEFQTGFGKMTKVEYPILGGIKNQSILRDYQWDGIRWMGFLIKYNLHAALCDDMGLGKTLQTLVVIANEVYKKQEKLKSLVVAPSTVVDHWYAETQKYINPQILQPQIYNNNNLDGNIIMISYNQLLKNQNLINQEYFFLVLDEAHILKNSKNKTSKLIKHINAKHKIVLSGTPVQNHLLELWSLFDILLPNYLGDEEYFKKHFSKAFHTNLFSLTEDEILFDEQQVKTLRLLHKKVLPFIMRRTKQDVLPQLPAKLIQDYPCQLSEPLQSQIYEIIENNSFSTEIEQQITTAQGEQKNQVCVSVLKQLHKLRQALDHPFLVKSQTTKRIKKKIKTDENIQEIKINQLLNEQTTPESYIHSGKMIALRDILQQLGFQSIDDIPQQQGDQITIYTNFNKVLVFSRFRAALSLIAEQLLQTQFPGLQYLVLDGSVPQSQRYPLVTKFNEDPDIRVLLLTTQVGGLGLNLSSANIVIMFDHDYNPVNDQQAMDRAHRIGQKNVVQVFRLIVKNTLEEKIMGIQRFKNAISKAIVNSDNASLKQMEKTDLLSMLESTANTKNDVKNSEDEQIEKLTGPYSKILGQLQLDLLEQLNFDKEY